MSTLDDVVAHATRYPFVALVELVEQLLASPAHVGEDGPIQEEALRFRHDPSLGFHTSDIARARLITPRDGRRYVELTTTFAGVTGSSSPLPAGMIEEIAQADDEESIQRDLIDGFHHRLLGLLYRGLIRTDLPRSLFSARAPEGALLLSARAPAGALTPAQPAGRMQARLLLLAGLAPDSAERLSGVALPWLLRLLPLLVAHPANARRLELAVRDVFGELLGQGAVRVLGLTGGMVELDPDECPKLGVDLLLGRTSCLGRRIAVPASGARLTIGPLPPESYAQLGPGGERFAELCAVITLFTPPTVDIEVELHPSETRQARLGRTRGTRLGLNAWLGARGVPTPVRFRAA